MGEGEIESALELALFYLKSIFVFIKCAFMIYKFSVSILRYKETYHTFKQYEIVLFTGQIALVFLMFYFDFISHNLNVLYFAFCFNALMNMASAYHLLLKALTALFNQRYRRL